MQKQQSTLSEAASAEVNNAMIRLSLGLAQEEKRNFLKR